MIHGRVKPEDLQHKGKKVIRELNRHYKSYNQIKDQINTAKIRPQTTQNRNKISS